MSDEFEGWHRGKVTSDGQQFEAYSTEVWGKTIHVEARLVDRMPAEWRDSFLRKERAKALALYSVNER